MPSSSLRRENAVEKLSAKMDISRLSAVEAASAIRAGDLTSSVLTRTLLDHIEAVDAQIQAWAYLDAEGAMEQAQAADEHAKRGDIKSLLHGIPVGVKDIFDTEDMPTERGTSIYCGRRPTRDCTVVGMMRRAGMVVLGKTVTTELASYSPGKTQNPHDPRRTPGGSSSGSAAAVAAGMVPLATGSQTYGSITRPASFCGVYGYKPTYGAISRHGVLCQSRQLDHVGVFARNLEDAAAVSSLLIHADDEDPDTLSSHLLQDLVQSLHQITARPHPRFAFIKTVLWDRVTVSAQSAFCEMVASLEDRVQEVTLPDSFGDAERLLVTIMEADMATNYATEYERSCDALSPMIRLMIERGQQCSKDTYRKAIVDATRLGTELEECLSRYDAILTPATCGEAPIGLDRTGDPAPCALWTLCRVPTLCVPLLRGDQAMPIGVQMVSGRGEDAQLFGAARWLVDFMSERRGGWRSAWA
ncbi:MAG: amidase [Gammaproteobacteria bacterium]